MDTLRGSRRTLDVDDVVVACENRRIVLRVAVWFAWNHQMLYGPVRREILIIRGMSARAGLLRLECEYEHDEGG